MVAVGNAYGCDMNSATALLKPGHSSACPSTR